MSSKINLEVGKERLRSGGYCHRENVLTLRPVTVPKVGQEGAWLLESRKLDSKTAGMGSRWPDGPAAQGMTSLEVCRVSGGAIDEGCGWRKAQGPGDRRSWVGLGTPTPHSAQRFPVALGEPHHCPLI